MDLPLPNGTLLTNSAALESTQGDSATASQTTTVQSDALLSLSQSYDPELVFPGGQLTITLSFSNSSIANETALGVTLTDTFPDNTIFVSNSGDGTIDNSGTLVTWPLGDLPPGAEGTRSLVVQVDSSLSDGTLLTSNATLQDSEGNSVASTISSAVGDKSTVASPDEPTVASTGEVTIFPSTVVLYPQSRSVTGSTPLRAGQDIVITGQQTQFFQEKSLLPEPTVLTKKVQPQIIEVQSTDTKKSPRLGCAAFLSLYRSDNPDHPVVVGDEITYTYTFTNFSSSETARDVLLKNSLFPGMAFIAASDGGIEVGGVITWYLGDIPPGGEGSRRLVTRVKSSIPNGSLLINNSAFLESEGAQCAWTNKSTTVKTVSDASITTEVVSIGDDDGDGFLNQFEETCGSNPQDPLSVCYILSLDDTVKTVQRGSHVTFTASVETDFNFEDPITFSSFNAIAGAMWFFSSTSAVLSESQKSASTLFTIMTTNSTPLGSHETTIIASSEGMTIQKSLILEVVE